MASKSRTEEYKITIDTRAAERAVKSLFRTTVRSVGAFANMRGALSGMAEPLDNLIRDTFQAGDAFQAMERGTEMLAGTLTNLLDGILESTGALDTMDEFFNVLATDIADADTALGKFVREGLVVFISVGEAAVITAVRIAEVVAQIPTAFNLAIDSIDGFFTLLDQRIESVNNADDAEDATQERLGRLAALRLQLSAGTISEAEFQERVNVVLDSTGAALTAAQDFRDASRQTFADIESGVASNLSAFSETSAGFDETVDSITNRFSALSSTIRSLDVEAGTATGDDDDERPSRRRRRRTQQRELSNKEIVDLELAKAADIAEIQQAESDRELEIIVENIAKRRQIEEEAVDAERAATEARLANMERYKDGLNRVADKERQIAAARVSGIRESANAAASLGNAAISAADQVIESDVAIAATKAALSLGLGFFSLATDPIGAANYFIAAAQFGLVAGTSAVASGGGGSRGGVGRAGSSSDTLIGTRTGADVTGLQINQPIIIGPVLDNAETGGQLVAVLKRQQMLGNL